jgi:hypothetical protein
MPDDLYNRDVLAWSEHQAALLRRVARGERVNDIDWEHVVEEIEDVGLSELNGVRSYLRQMILHLLKCQGWPNSPALEHWNAEISNFQSEAEQRFAPSMRQRIDVHALYRRALRQLSDMTLDGKPPQPVPEECPFTLDDLLAKSLAELSALLDPSQP